MEIGSVGVVTAASEVTPVDALAFLLLLSQSEALEGRIRDQFSEIKGRNDEMKAINDKLAEVRKVRSGLEENDDTTTLSNDLREFFEKSGIVIPGNGQEISKEELSALIENVKARSDELSQSNQLQNVRFQDLKKKYDSTFDFLSNVLKSTASSRDGIIRNVT
ncbi:hypothetical protein [Spartinivicinus ruber]|uniref:hypothetical protein n=1 Tax=Spartinivicinus ruber TaxID=2683272 RepID=UPI0013D84243|nr:hypothetical protein [Spartinivicinus ruber]